MFTMVVTIDFTIPTNKLQNEVDIDLRQKIMGLWKSQPNYSISFYLDSTFIDSIYFDDISDTNYYNYGLFVRKGKYIIQNEILTLTDFYFDKVTVKSNIGMDIEEKMFKVSLNNGVLILTPFKLFYNVGQKKEQLCDVWETRGCWCGSSASIIEENFIGTYLKRYTFQKDSVDFYLYEKYTHSLEGTQEYKSYQKFSFNNPYLYIDENENKIRVEFKNDNMYWNYDYLTMYLFKD